MKTARATRVVISALVVCIGLSVCSASGADWAQFRGPNRDGKSEETGLLKKWPEGGPELLWSVEDKLGLGLLRI